MRPALLNEIHTEARGAAKWKAIYLFFLPESVRTPVTLNKNKSCERRWFSPAGSW